MRRTLALLTVLSAAVALASSGLNAQSDLREMRDFFKNLTGGPYIYLQTPRTDFGLGSIYLIEDKTTYFVSKPEACFPPSVLEDATSNLRPLKRALDSSYSVEVGLKVAPAGPLTEEAKAELKKNGVTGVQVSIPNLRQEAITILTLQKAIKAGAIDQDCLTGLNRRPERWLIVEALTAPDYTVTFQRKTGASGGLSLGLFSMLFPTFKGEKERLEKGELEFKDAQPPYIVAVKALKFKKATEFASDPTTAESVAPEEYYARVDK